MLKKICVSLMSVALLTACSVSVSEGEPVLNDSDVQVIENDKNESIAYRLIFNIEKKEFEKRFSNTQEQIVEHIQNMPNFNTSK